MSVHLLGTLFRTLLNAAHTLCLPLDTISSTFTSRSTSTLSAFAAIYSYALYTLLTYLLFRVTRTEVQQDVWIINRRVCVCSDSPYVANPVMTVTNFRLPRQARERQMRFSTSCFCFTLTTPRPPRVCRFFFSPSALASPSPSFSAHRQTALPRFQQFHPLLACAITYQSSWLVAWRSGNALCRINEVSLQWAQLVLGWVTVYRQLNHLGTKPAS